MLQRGMWAMIACSIAMVGWVIWLSMMDRKETRKHPPTEQNLPERPGVWKDGDAVGETKETEG